MSRATYRTITPANTIVPVIALCWAEPLISPRATATTPTATNDQYTTENQPWVRTLLFALFGPGISPPYFQRSSTANVAVPCTRKVSRFRRARPSAAESAKTRGYSADGEEQWLRVWPCKTSLVQRGIHIEHVDGTSAPPDCSGAGTQQVDASLPRTLDLHGGPRHPYHRLANGHHPGVASVNLLGDPRVRLEQLAQVVDDKGGPGLGVRGQHLLRTVDTGQHENGRHTGPIRAHDVGIETVTEEQRMPRTEPPGGFLEDRFLWFARNDQQSPDREVHGRNQRAVAWRKSSLHRQGPVCIGGDPRDTTLRHAGTLLLQRKRSFRQVHPAHVWGESLHDCDGVVEG